MAFWFKVKLEFGLVPEILHRHIICCIMFALKKFIAFHNLPEIPTLWNWKISGAFRWDGSLGCIRCFTSKFGMDWVSWCFSYTYCSCWKVLGTCGAICRYLIFLSTPCVIFCVFVILCVCVCMILCMCVRVLWPCGWVCACVCVFVCVGECAHAHSFILLRKIFQYTDQEVSILRDKNIHIKKKSCVRRIE
jgi:hypothetical protein